MHIPWKLALLSIFWAGCNQIPDNPGSDHSGVCACISDTTSAHTAYTAVRGALLGTRFASLDELKSVVRIAYYNNAADGNCSVQVRHCSGGREVTSILQTGTSQGDILKARYDGALWDRVNLLFSAPAAVAQRKDLEKIYALSRLRPEWFGAGDVAFFEMAKSMARHINTPDMAFKNTRDSTEKGYLNSFNHITAQAFITACFSEELADFIADAHERYRHPELITGQFTATQLADLEEGPVDNYVDIVNNEWGQELGKQLREKYSITPETPWTPQLLAHCLNDIQAYYSWAFQIGFIPYRPGDDEVQQFARKLDETMRARLSFNP